MEIRDLSKYGAEAVARGRGLAFEDTSSPVDPGDKGKVAEAVDVCFPEKVDNVKRQFGHAGGVSHVCGSSRVGCVVLRAGRSLCCCVAGLRVE